MMTITYTKKSQDGYIFLIVTTNWLHMKLNCDVLTKSTLWRETCIDSDVASQQLRETYQ
jgi:hypothetical protein